ncbi:hotdog fold thioesterase [Micrococcus porci]|uniref:PaaI family thioesterase n=1 Tax=Micrococcus porci TaxID=2856555 RepID=UPI001CCC3512|nr:hotdog fold thioesterase [Micrococcus porci]UBH25320.1 hotdog fold thioesterase [Micrococcus porci]
MTETPHHPALVGDRVARWLGVTLEAAEKDHARIRMTLGEEHHNAFGMAHGGVVFAFADCCFALTCNDPASDGSTLTVASGVDVNFLSGTRAGQTLVAEGRLVAAAGRSAVYDITVTTDDGTLVAAFRGRSRTVAVKGA